MPMGQETPPRRSNRIYARLPITLLIPVRDSKVTEKAFTVNLSESGARVRTSTPLAPGQRIDVFPNEGLKHAIPSRVVWVERGALDRVGEAGLEFLQPLRARG